MVIYLRIAIGLRPEAWGRWTIAPQAALSFAIGAPRELGFALSVSALLSPSAPKQSMWIEVNQCRVGSAEFDLAHGSAPHTISAIIPWDCIDANGKIIFYINTDRVRSPREIGINDQTLPLGLGVENIIIYDTAEHVRH